MVATEYRRLPRTNGFILQGHNYIYMVCVWVSQSFQSKDIGGCPNKLQIVHLLYLHVHLFFSPPVHHIPSFCH